MPTSLACLLGFVAWTFFLVLCIATIRITQVLTRQARVTAFPADKPHGTAPYQRLLRAHLNCVENLPLFGCTVLVAHTTGVPLPVWAPPLYLAARVLQSCTHVISGRGIAINVRFVFFMTQSICLGCMGAALWPRAWMPPG